MPLEPASVLLTDRVAVVTGAAAGIGRSIAESFAAFGADVAVCDRDAENLDTCVAAIEGRGRRAVKGVLDVRDGDAVRAFVAEAVDSLGPVDVLVNNAGGTFASLFMDTNDKGQDALIRQNFTSVTNFVRAVVPTMPPRGGSIINVTSIEAHRAGPMFGVYSAMKAAVFSLTKTLSLELGARLIRVNCIAPDVIPTPGIGDMGEPRTPLPVTGHVDDCAAAAIYLAGDLGRFVTGTTVHVDGGNLAAGGWHARAEGGWSS